MKRTSQKKRIITFLSVCAMVGFAHAQISHITERSSMANQQATINGKTSFDAPYPFTSNDLMEQLLKVLEQPEGSITKEQVEAIFGVRLPEFGNPEQLPDGSVVKHYRTQTGVDWYFSLGHSDVGRQQTHFDFSWHIPKSNNLYPTPPDGMCMDATAMMKFIEKRGWQLKDEVRFDDIADFGNTYWKGEHGFLRLHFAKKTHCVVGLDMSFYIKRYF